MLVRDIIIPVDGIPVISTTSISMHILGANNNTVEDKKIRTAVTSAGWSTINNGKYIRLNTLKDGSELIESCNIVYVTNKDEYYSAHKNIDMVVHRYTYYSSGKDGLCINKGIPMRGYLLSRAAIDAYKDVYYLKKIHNKDKMIQIIIRAFEDYYNGYIDNVVPCVLDSSNTQESDTTEEGIFDKIRSIIQEEEEKATEGTDNTINCNVVSYDICTPEGVSHHTTNENVSENTRTIPDVFIENKCYISREILLIINKNIDKFYKHSVAESYADDVLEKYVGVREEYNSYYVFFLSSSIVNSELKSKSIGFVDVVKALKRDKLLWNKVHITGKKSYHVKCVNGKYLFNFPVMIAKSVIDRESISNNIVVDMEKEIADLKARLAYVEEKVSKDIESMKREFENAVNYRVKNEINSIWTALAELKEKEDLTKNGLRRLVESL